MRILYVCNDGEYFAAHRLWLAQEARRRGASVAVAAGGRSELAQPAGERTIPLVIDRHRADLKGDLALALAVRRLAREERADVVHLITIKPVLFGALGLIGSRAPGRIVATFPGLGRIFDLADASPKARLRRWMVAKALKAGLANPRARAIFETEADRDTLLRLGVLPPERAVHIPGAGVDPRAFPLTPPPAGRFTVLFAGRLLRAKGVLLLVEAARIAREQGAELETLIAGAPQEGDPDALDPADMAALTGGGPVRYLGAVPGPEMPALLARAHAVALPTAYPEGVPRILIEAAAVGRMAITSSHPGCRALVEPDGSGVILDELTPKTLAAVLTALAADRARVERLCAGARRRFEEGGFAQDAVAAATLALYAP